MRARGMPKCVPKVKELAYRCVVHHTFRLDWFASDIPSLNTECFKKTMLDRVQAQIPINLTKTSRRLLPRSMIGAVRRPLVGPQARRWISCKYTKPPHLPRSSRGLPEAAPKVRNHTMVLVIWPLGTVSRRACRTASMEGYTKKSEFILVAHGFPAHRFLKKVGNMFSG